MTSAGQITTHAPSVPVVPYTTGVDGVLTKLVERIYLGIDFVNFSKNLAFLAAYGMSVAKITSSVASASKAILGSVPVANIFTGGLYIYTGHKGMTEAGKELKKSVLQESLWVKL